MGMFNTTATTGRFGASERAGATGTLNHKLQIVHAAGGKDAGQGDCCKDGVHEGTLR